MSNKPTLEDLLHQPIQQNKEFQEQVAELLGLLDQQPLTRVTELKVDLVRDMLEGLTFELAHDNIRDFLKEYGWKRRVEVTTDIGEFWEAPVGGLKYAPTSVLVPNDTSIRRYDQRMSELKTDLCEYYDCDLTELKSRVRLLAKKNKKET